MKESSNKRGRPVTGQALTPAQKQKAYRERQKDQLKVVSIGIQSNKRLDDLETMNRILSQELFNERKKSDGLQEKLWALEVKLSRLKK